MMIHRATRVRPALLSPVLATLVTVGLLASPAAGQLKKERKKPVEAAPAGPVASQPPRPIADQVLARDQMKDWTIRTEVHVQAGTYYETVDKVPVVQPRSLEFGSVAIVFPILERSAAHESGVTGAGDDSFKGEFYFNDVLIDSTPTFAQGYQSGTRLARWEGRDLKGVEADLKIEFQVYCYETRYDHALAETIPWPKFWPPVAQSTLKPQMFVDYVVGTGPDPADKTVANFVKKATDGKDPASIPPATLAKWLAGRILESVQPSGDGLIHNSHNEGLAGTIKGFELKGASQTIRDGRGSEHDIACVTAAVFKAAGLPARTLIGWDVYDQKSNDGLGSKSGRGKFRSWVEFCLVDPVSRQEIWIPVDVVRMRKSGSRAKPLDQPWKYFGTNDELAYVIPLAFQYHPPTTVYNLVPALWGWLTNPQSRVYANSFNFTTFRAPRRGDQDNLPPGRGR